MDEPVVSISGTKKNPTDFLKQVIGKPVIVKLNSGVTYRGILACLDGFMNIAMEQTEEYIDGQLKNRYGDCFIRGNNGKDILHCTTYVFDHFFPHSFLSSFIHKCSQDKGKVKWWQDALLIGIDSK